MKEKEGKERKGSGAYVRRTMYNAQQDRKKNKKKEEEVEMRRRQQTMRLSYACHTYARRVTRVLQMEGRLNGMLMLMLMISFKTGVHERRRVGARPCLFLCDTNTNTNHEPRTRPCPLYAPCRPPLVQRRPASPRVAFDDEYPAPFAPSSPLRPFAPFFALLPPPPPPPPASAPEPRTQRVPVMMWACGGRAACGGVHR